MRGIAELFRAEVLKIRHQRLPVFTFLFAVGGAGISPLLLLLFSRVPRSPDGVEAIPTTGYEALTLGVWVGFFFGGILLSILTALSISGEAASGTMRTALVQPIGRLDWFIAKSVLLSLVALLLALLIWLAAILSAKLLFGYGDVTDPIYTEYIWLEEAEMWRHIRLVALMSIGPTLSLIGVGMLVSTLTDSPAYAVAGLMGAMLLFGPVLGGISADLRPYLVFGYVGEWLRVLGDVAKGDRTEEAALAFSAGNAIVPLLVFGGGLLISALLFRRRDVHV